MERRRTTPHIRNSPTALSNKNRQKKNRKGSVTFTVIGNSNSIVWRLYFYLESEKYNLHTIELLFPITVKVTEPLRFFFCRFLLESAVGLFLICGVVLRLSIWIFYISKIQMGGIYGEICTKKGIYQRKWRLCGIILHGVLPLQGIRPDLYGQAVYPHSRLSA